MPFTFQTPPGLVSPLIVSAEAGSQVVTFAEAGVLACPESAKRRSSPLLLLSALLLFAVSSLAVTITQAEYFLNNDPGQGLATPVTITPGSSVTISALQISTVSLPDNRSHRLYLRYLSDEGYWTFPEGRYFFILSGSTPTVDTIRVVQAEYWFDALPATTVDILDSSSSAYAALIPTAALTPDRLHTFFTRYLDDNGIWSAVTARYFYIIQGGGGSVQLRVITDFEYWFDSNPPTPLNPADAATISFTSLIPTTGLSTGLHSFSIRYRDDSGIWSLADARRFVMISQTSGNSAPSFLTGAEYFVNGDPGIGNAIPIVFPQDSAWNESGEESAVLITNLPIGMHLFCLRYKDNNNIWSAAFCDSVFMTPILVIRPSGPNVILSWQADTTHIPFNIYRADAFSGPYTQIAQTNVPTYTDAVGVTDLKKYYRVTTNSTTLSSYRLPKLATSSPPRD